ncbi:hypothetical protein AB0O10_39020 [Streptomyces lydicus]
MVNSNASLDDADVAIAAARAGAEAVHARYGQRLTLIDKGGPGSAFPRTPGFRAVDLLAHPGFVERLRPRVVSTTPALTSGRGLVVAADAETHGLLLSMIRGPGRL